MDSELSHDIFFLRPEETKKLAREIVDAPFLKVLKARLDGFLRSLI